MEELIKNPIKNIDILTERQNIIKTMFDDKSLNKDIEIFLNTIKKLEKGILWFWKEINPDTNQLLDMVYFKNRFLKKFNNNEKVLQLYNYFKIIFAPLYGLLSPIFLIIMPFIYLKLLIIINKLTKFRTAIRYNNKINSFNSFNISVPTLCRIFQSEHIQKFSQS